MEDKKIQELNGKIEYYHKWFSTGSRKWSFAYHTCLFGTTILTLLISFLVKASFFHGLFGIEKDDVISFLALVAAILSALIAKGGLDKKWRSNRINKGKVENLEIDLLKDQPDYGKVIDNLEKIISDHDIAIVSSSVEVLDDNSKK